MTENFEKNLKTLANISLAQAQREKFDCFYRFLIETNEKFNLTTITDEQSVENKHFIDSVMGGVAILPNSKVCDIGSGAGFPSIPLAIVRDDLDITAVDSTAKKVEFINQTANKLNLRVSGVCARIEEMKSYRESFDCVTSRALAPLSTLLEYSAPLLAVGGRLVAYKTDESELDNIDNACKILSMSFTQALPYLLPDGSKRTLFIFVKTAPTDAKYPRQGNKPRKYPL